MHETWLQAPAPTSLTSLTEEENLFRDTVRQLDGKVRPLVKVMDEKGVFEKDLIDQFFRLGLMGIEIPDQYGGGGGKFFDVTLAVEELSRVDLSAGVVVNGQNMLVNNALRRTWGSVGPTRCPVIRARQNPPIRISLLSGKMLTPASSSLSKLTLSTQSLQ